MSAAEQVSGATIEEIDSDDEVPEVVEGGDAAAAAVETSRVGQNRNEKKARKALSKLGLKPVTGVKRIVVKRGPSSVLFVVNQPEVLKNPGTESYVVYGIASTVGDEQASLAQAAQQFNPELMAALQSQAGAAGAADGANAGADAAVEDDDNEVVDEEGLTANDIELVMEQAKVSRSKAAKTLRANEGDVVNSIMELTM